MSKNNKSEIIEKIKAKAYDKVNEKLKLQQEETDRKIKSDLSQVEACLELIENQMVFKKVKDGWRDCHEYIIATEEMFLEDYSKEKKDCYVSGIQFGSKHKAHYEYLFRVNGEYYYDTNYMIDAYIRDFDDYSARCRRLYAEVRDFEKEREKLIAQSQEIKKVLKSVELFKTSDILDKYLTDDEK